jgi:hypothetical protein
MDRNRVTQSVYSMHNKSWGGGIDIIFGWMTICEGDDDANNNGSPISVSTTPFALPYLWWTYWSIDSFITSNQTVRYLTHASPCSLQRQAGRQAGAHPHRHRPPPQQQQQAASAATLTLAGSAGSIEPHATTTTSSRAAAAAAAYRPSPPFDHHAPPALVVVVSSGRRHPHRPHSLPPPPPLPSQQQQQQQQRGKSICISSSNSSSEGPSSICRSQGTVAHPNAPSTTAVVAAAEPDSAGGQ